MHLICVFLLTLRLFEYSVSSLKDESEAHKKSVELSCFNLGLKDLLDYLDIPNLYEQSPRFNVSISACSLVYHKSIISVQLFTDPSI